ncbi:putative fatty acyl-CoA reductase CG5065 [Sitophilus oryzae]|uniref:Fatty acyl-CoA reductase n=1 Tax=Sitophilus oryzae TaxID=7048 RepID=A0A6J2Y0Q4_SITOR|nr:putative fatty acyl-CoA reductase CG5065 [Sitophilus oryzae]
MDKKMEKHGGIKEFYKGKHIFITGGTGFVGKAIIEKILRSCPESGNIYMLLRSKKGKSLNERLQQLLSNPLFDLLKTKNPNILKKIIPIAGNVLETGLGLSKEDRQLLIEKVNIVIHSAASVRFDDFLKTAIFLNLRSTRDLALLALEMKNINVFLHISTAYCNVHGKVIVEEKLYPAEADWREAVYVAENCNENIMNVLSLKCMDKFPNSYTYTKHLAEHCINDLLASKVATVIVRPTIVTPSIYEPFGGWVDNFNGVVGMLTGGAMGLVGLTLGKEDMLADCVPVDEAVKVMLSGCFVTGLTGPKDTVDVLQASAYGLKRWKIKQIIKIGKRAVWEVPFEKQIWHTRGGLTSSTLYYYINVVLFNLIPAIFLDLFIRIAGHKPIIFKIQRKIYIATTALMYFMSNQWDFLNEKAMGNFSKVPENEAEEFCVKIYERSEEEIYDYYKNAIDGTRWILLGESKQVKPNALRNKKRFFYLDRATNALFYFSIFWFIFFKIEILSVVFHAIRNYWNSLE